MAYRKPGRRFITRQPGETLKQELAEFCAALVDAGLKMDEATQAFQKEYLTELLLRFKGNQCKVARDQGMHRNTLSRLLSELKLDAKQFKRGHRHGQPGTAGTGFAG